MVLGEELRDLVFQQTTRDVLRWVAVNIRMRSLEHTAVDKIKEGTMRLEEAYRVVSF